MARETANDNGKGKTMATEDVKAFRLADAIDLFEDSSQFVFTLKREHDSTEVEFQDESGLSGRNNDSFFVAGFNGWQVLIHARSFEAAWEAWVDEMPTIPEDELIEAYGIEDDYRETFEASDPCPKYCEREAWDAWYVRFKAACRARLAELEDKARDGAGEYPELIEGYEMQSSASGTGIVDMGHYASMIEIDPDEITVRRKTAEELAEDKRKKEEKKAGNS